MTPEQYDFLPKPPEAQAGLAGDTQLQQALLSAIKKAMDRTRTARRAEVQRTRDQRLYFRGDQNLGWNEDAGRLMYGGDFTQDDDDAPNMRVFNVIQGYGLSFISTWGQAVAKVRAEAKDNPFDPVQIAAAAKAETYRRVFEKLNNPKALTMEMARLGWTDGRILSYVSRDEYDTERVELFGVLEHRLLLTTRVDPKQPLRGVPIVQIETEKPLCTLRKLYDDPKDKDGKSKITAADGDSYERNARVAVAQLLGSDTEYGQNNGSLVDGMGTETKSFLRPDAYYLDFTEIQRKRLEEEFPSGLCVVHSGTTYLDSFECDMDACLDCMMVMPGDGVSRPSRGSAGMALQDSVNEFGNLIEETMERGLPRTWLDDQAINVDGLKNQDTSPGSVVQIRRKGNEAIASHLFQEQAISPAAQVFSYFENLTGPMMQFATGQQPALYGAQMQDQKTASGYAQAKNQALGLMAIVWLPYQGWYARLLTQAVNLASQRDSDIQASLPSTQAAGKSDNVRIMPGELVGAQFVMDSDDNFPESYTDQRNAYMALLQMGANNPAFAPILTHPDNMAYGRRLIGLPDLVIPAADSRNKQLDEIRQMQKNNQPLRSADGVVQPSEPPQQTSVEVDPDFDDHATELAECTRWLNSSEGQTAKVNQPDWFQDVRLHALAHKQAIAAAQPAQHQDKPQIRINYADLTPQGKVQAAAEGGIQENPADVQAKQVQDQPPQPLAA